MTRREQIQNHYESVWQNNAIVCSFSNGPTHELPADFSVLKFPPNRHRNMWTYATCCMSAPSNSPPIELHLFSPHESEEIVELLFAAAHYHRTAAHLDLHHTVNFGRGWQEKSPCDHGFISLPYLDGPNLENLPTENGATTKFYWLIPITQAELDFKRKFGVEALEQQFDKSLNYLNPMRCSIV
jgi:hypothetical protein